MYEPHHGADDPNRRSEPAGLLERRRARRVAGGHPVDLGLENVADERRIAAVDDQLQALAGEVVVDLRELGVQGEQPLAAGLLGKRDQ